MTVCRPACLVYPANSGKVSLIGREFFRFLCTVLCLKTPRFWIVQPGRFHIFDRRPDTLHVNDLPEERLILWTKTEWVLLYFHSYWQEFKCRPTYFVSSPPPPKFSPWCLQIMENIHFTKNTRKSDTSLKHVNTAFYFLSEMEALKIDVFYHTGLFCQIHHLLMFGARWAASRHV